MKYTVEQYGIVWLVKDTAGKIFSTCQRKDAAQWICDQLNAQKPDLSKEIEVNEKKERGE